MGLTRTTGMTAGMVRRFVVMAVLALFAFGPVAEGLVCGPEIMGLELTGGAHQQASAFDESHEDQGTSPAQDASCAHGHCHHSGAALGQRTIAAAEPILQLVPLNPVFDSSAPPSASLLRLERPPRA